MTELRVTVRDETADRLAELAADRGTSPETIAAEVIEEHLPPTKSRHLPFIAMFESPDGFDVQKEEAKFEAEGFVASS